MNLNVMETNKRTKLINKKIKIAGGILVELIIAGSAYHNLIITIESIKSEGFSSYTLYRMAIFIFLLSALVVSLYKLYQNKYIHE